MIKREKTRITERIVEEREDSDYGTNRLREIRLGLRSEIIRREKTRIKERINKEREDSDYVTN